MTLRLIFLLLLLIGFLSSEALANLKDTQAQLQQIRKRIETAQSDLKKKQRTEVKLSHELSRLKQALAGIDTRIKELGQEQRKIDKDIALQREQIAENKKSSRAIGKRVERRLVALYKEGELGPLRVLFTADSPTELVQQYHYLTRVLHADKELLAEYREVLSSQKTHLEELEGLQKKQQTLIARVEQERKVANEGRALQAELLGQVRKDKKQLNRELRELQEKAGRLQQLVSKLKAAPAPSTGSGANDFLSGKGKLEWPVSGTVLIGFGTKKDPQLGTIYESNGLEIATRIGQPIRAVADGRVAFADYFKGYGNLVILSHAGGFHTLYAHAAKLDCSAGQPVRAGELLGHSGLKGRDSIYFEIRENGSPVNPTNWLKRR